MDLKITLNSLNIICIHRFEMYLQNIFRLIELEFYQIEFDQFLD